MPINDPFRDDDDLDETDLADEDPWADEDEDEEFDPMVESPVLKPGSAVPAVPFEDVVAARGVDGADVAARRDELERREVADALGDATFHGADADTPYSGFDEVVAALTAPVLWPRPEDFPEELTNPITVETLRELVAEAPVKIIGPDATGVAALAVEVMLPAAMGLWMITTNVGVYPVRPTDVVLHVLAAPKSPQRPEQTTSYAEVADAVAGALKAPGTPHDIPELVIETPDITQAVAAPRTAGGKAAMAKGANFVLDVAALDVGWRTVVPVVGHNLVTVAMLRGTGEDLERLELTWNAGRFHTGFYEVGSRRRRLTGAAEALRLARHTREELALAHRGSRPSLG